ncbi:MAG TPA: hypothetical protein VGL34_23935 [Steroidobacteraceae bacterium]|jgi:hypothetical protein
MTEIRTVTTLRSKRDEIAGVVEKYERLLGQARADLAYIEAAISIFEASGDPRGSRPMWTCSIYSSAASRPNFASRR